MSIRDSSKPRRLITKVRRYVGRSTLYHRPKNIYDRNAIKREMQDLIEEDCTCIGMECTCDLKEEEDVRA